MQIIEVQQGTIDWRMAKLGIPSASNFDKIITPTGQLSKQSIGYMYGLIAEAITGVGEEAPQTQFMERGTELEPEARSYYEFNKSCMVRQVGFCKSDTGLYGCSPDGLVGDDGGIEIKCPAPKNQIAYLLDEDSLVAAYRCQVQGCLYVCEREWWDMISYCPGLPSPIIRVYRDEEFIEKLAAALNTFCWQLAEFKEKIIKMRNEISLPEMSVI